jgi:SAM-dependent methyltransferase
MDLVEIGLEPPRRHPWESARLRTILRILKAMPLGRSDFHVLDVGCGDGYVSWGVAAAFRRAEVSAVDIHLSGARAPFEEVSSGNVKFSDAYEGLISQGYEIVLALDVLEHIPEDAVFLSEIARRYTAPGGFVIITVPAFSALFGPHDRFLGHLRRYGRGRLLKLIEQSGLECLQWGSLFASPLILRAAAVLSEKVFPFLRGRARRGVGQWRRGPKLTKLLEGILSRENALLLSCARRGIRFPGLTNWALCRKPL